MKSRFAVILFASVLLLSGGSCGQLFDEYTLGEDTDSSSDSSKRYWESEKKRLEEELKKAAEKPRRPPTNVYSEIAGKTPDEIRWMAPLLIPVLTLNGERFPFPSDQFTKTAPDKCLEEHYHATVGYTLELKRVFQPAEPCGFGSAVTIEEVDVEKMIKWMQEGPKAQRR